MGLESLDTSRSDFKTIIETHISPINSLYLNQNVSFYALVNESLRVRTVSRFSLITINHGQLKNVIFMT